MNSRFQFLVATLAMIAMVGCSKNGGYESASNIAPSSPLEGENGQGNNPGGTLPAPIQSVDMKGFVDGGENDAVQTIDLDKEKGELIISLPMGADMTLGLSNGSLTALPGVTFYTTVNPKDNKAYFVVRVPVRHFLRGVNTLPAGKLPNGDPLPFMPSGEAAALAFEINTGTAHARKAYLYIGVEAVGLFVESKWITCGDLPICIAPWFSIKNAAKTRVIGRLSTVMPKNGKDGGLFISTIIPPEIARILDQYFIR